MEEDQTILVDFVKTFTTLTKGGLDLLSNKEVIVGDERVIWLLLWQKNSCITSMGTLIYMCASIHNLSL
jgi:hypothetical protein